MEIIKKSPDPFFYQGKKNTAILLIHGFTGSPAEMRLLGEYLYEKDFTVYAPLLAGHGLTPEAMMKTDETDWWNSVLEGYQYLKDRGYSRIFAIGLSMGGILTLKLAINRELAGAVTMAAPIIVQDKRIGFARWFKYVKTFKMKEKKEKHIEMHLASYDRTPIACVESLNRLIKGVKKELNKVNIPIKVMQGKKDETVYYESANYIYDHVSSLIKELNWYEKSTHIMTLDREKEKVYVDILSFLEKLNIN